MRSGAKNIIISQLRNGISSCQGWPTVTCLGLPCFVLECGPSTSGRNESNALDLPFIRNGSSVSVARPSSPVSMAFGTVLLQRQVTPSQPVRFATTSADAPTSSTTTATTTTTTTTTSPSPSPGAVSAETFPAGLAQLYPDPDAIPEHVLRRLRQQLFGRTIQPGEQTGRRALARPLQGRVLADWYFMPPSEVPGFHNEEREYEMSKALNKRHRKRDAEAGEEAAAGKAGGKKK